MEKQNKDSKAIKLANWLTKKAVDGMGPLSSSEELANEYLFQEGYKSDDERVNSLIRWESAKTFGTGFITGVGGAVTMPVAIPSALVAAFTVQARLVGAIAKIYGHDVKEDRVKTAILLTLIGGEATSLLKNMGIRAGELYAKKAISKISGATLREINKKIGIKLLTKAGQKSVVNLTKLVPCVGGAIGGTIDAFTTRAVGLAAKKAFAPKNNAASDMMA